MIGQCTTHNARDFCQIHRPQKTEKTGLSCRLAKRQLLFLTALPTGSHGVISTFPATPTAGALFRATVR
eukprot:scaffold308533_cov60-Attheya_sp.AAC.1